VIVTCPSCSSKYRVRDEAVPPEGAELQCPTCNAHFVAHPPKVNADQLASALEKVTRARDVAEARVQELEGQLAAGADAHRRLQDEVTRLRAAALDAADTHRRLTDEVARLRATAADSAELVQVKQTLFEAQKKQKATAAEVDVANSLISTLQTEVNSLRAQAAKSAGLTQVTQRATALQAELDVVRGQLEEAQRAQRGSSSMSPELAGLTGAVTPMLWGLEQALVYLEQFAGTEPTLAGHVKQLRLLQKVLTRLAEASK
jgi:predicted Zn finger-like uncharacterized protein